MNILIVEDHEASAKALARCLERKLPGTMCHIAGNYWRGREMAAAMTMDITIVDLCLPDAGIDEVIKSCPLWTHPVIIVTDLDDTNHEIEIRCYENCAQNFFTKAELRREIYENLGADLISAITKAHWRERLPQQKKQRELSNAQR